MWLCCTNQGEGEWKVRQRDVRKHRTWRKLHFCTDEATPEIVSVVASTNDAEAMPDLLQDAQGKIEQVSADGAYDQRKYYDALNEYGAKRNVSITLRHLGEKFGLQEETRLPLPAAAAGG